MPQGTVKKLVEDPPFAFISTDQDDVIFHHWSMEGSRFDGLQPGQVVECEIDTSPDPRRRDKRAASAGRQAGLNWSRSAPGE